ncbi:MAG: hypothetical protein ACIAQ0_05530 [Phycisphaerales bacterium JB058]
MRYRGIGGLAVFLSAGVTQADVTYYAGVNTTYASARASFEADFLLFTGESVPMENFESFAGGAEVGDMPGNDGRFAPEYADGSPAPLPIIQSTVAAPSGSSWMQNFGNGRPFGASWVIRPDNPGDSIYAFGQTNAQGDWVRVLGYDAQDNLIASIDASNAGTAFAGFISDVPLAKVVVTPLGNGDFANGMDDVYVSVTPVPAPGGVGLLVGAGLLAARRRR